MTSEGLSQALHSTFLSYLFSNFLTSGLLEMSTRFREILPSTLLISTVIGHFIESFHLQRDGDIWQLQCVYSCKRQPDA